MSHTYSLFSMLFIVTLLLPTILNNFLSKLSTTFDNYLLMNIKIQNITSLYDKVIILSSATVTITVTSARILFGSIPDTEIPLTTSS